MNKIYACSDLHGNFDLYNQINNVLGSSDTVYFLGDAGDRGPNGWKCIEAIYNNPQWVYLKGNHEDMMAKSLHDHDEYNLWMYNGGKITLIQFMDEYPDINDRKEWYKKLAALPISQHVINNTGHTIYLSHAGLMRGNDYDMVWDRTHFFYNDEELMSTEHIVHGHTPTELLRERIDTEEDFDDDNFDPTNICVYNDGHKIDIDCGTAWTNKAALLDLDTFQVRYFYSNGGVDND